MFHILYLAVSIILGRAIYLDFDHFYFRIDMLDSISVKFLKWKQILRITICYHNNLFTSAKLNLWFLKNGIYNNAGINGNELLLYSFLYIFVKFHRKNSGRIEVYILLFKTNEKKTEKI